MWCFNLTFDIYKYLTNEFIVLQVKIKRVVKIRINDLGFYSNKLFKSSFSIFAKHNLILWLWPVLIRSESILIYCILIDIYNPKISCLKCFLNYQANSFQWGQVILHQEKLNCSNKNKRHLTERKKFWQRMKLQVRLSTVLTLELLLKERKVFTSYFIKRVLFKNRSSTICCWNLFSLRQLRL